MHSFCYKTYVFIKKMNPVFAMMEEGKKLFRFYELLVRNLFKIVFIFIQMLSFNQFFVSLDYYSTQSENSCN